MVKKNFISSLLFGLLSVLFFYGCTTDSNPEKRHKLEGVWRLEGLNQLEIYKINSTAESVLFATNFGVYAKEQKNIVEFGLQDKPVLNVVETSNGYITALKVPHVVSGDTIFFKKEASTNNWSPFLNNYGGKEGTETWISNLEVSPNNRNVLFASGGGNIVKSTDGGKTWFLVDGYWDSLGKNLFIKIDGNTVWAGGVNAIFEPALIRSGNGGETWQNLSKNIQFAENIRYETNAYDLAIRTQKPMHLLVGLGIGIIKSADNGASWNPVFDKAGIRTFTYSTANPELVYASGVNARGQLFFIASNDFGDTWQTIEYPESPAGIHVNDMVSVMEDGKEVLYLGTNKGVYSYTFEE